MLRVQSFASLCATLDLAELPRGGAGQKMTVTGGDLRGDGGRLGAQAHCQCIEEVSPEAGPDRPTGGAAAGWRRTSWSVGHRRGTFLMSNYSRSNSSLHQRAQGEKVAQSDGGGRVARDLSQRADLAEGEWWSFLFKKSGRCYDRSLRSVVPWCTEDFLTHLTMCPTRTHI